MTPTTQILIGDVRQQLRTLPEKSVHAVITSPPYWGLRDYGVPPQVWGGDESCAHEWGDQIQVNATNHTDKRRWNHTRNGRDELQPTEKRVAWLRTKIDQGQLCLKCEAWQGSLGLEPTPELFCRNLVEVFREVWRVLRDDGCLFVNLGDSYSGGGRGNYDTKSRNKGNSASRGLGRPSAPGLKPKDLVGIPWMAAFALRSAGWYLRSDIPWLKRAAMPESVTDRPAKALEYVFMFSKTERYYFDMEAVRRSPSGIIGGAAFGKINLDGPGSRECMAADRERYATTGRNFRNADLWFESISEPHGLCTAGDELVGLDINPEPVTDAHFATFPRKLVEPFVKAGTSERGCCMVCGAPWERIVEKPQKPERQDYEGKHLEADEQSAGHRLLAGTRGARAIRWDASCECNASVVPCTVLDPFGGSGTTLLVAKSLGRNGIATELNPEFAAIAEDRIARGYNPAQKQEVLAGQKSLFTESNELFDNGEM